MYEIFSRSISISISRSIPILSPIFLIILLSEFRPDWVTPFSLCFSVLSIVCVLPILLGIVIQIDNERSFSLNNLLVLSLILITYFILLYIFFIFYGKSIFWVNDANVSKDSYDIFMLVILSIPFLGLSCILGMFLEKIKKEKSVLKIRFLQLTVEVILISLLLIFTDKINYLAFVYVFCDFLFLIPLILLTFNENNFNSNLILKDPLNYFIEIVKYLFPILVGTFFLKYLSFLNLSIAAKISIESSNIFSILNSLVSFFTLPLIGLHAIIVIEGSKINKKGYEFIEEIYTVLVIYVKVCFVLLFIFYLLFEIISFLDFNFEILLYISNHKISLFLLMLSSFITIGTTAISIAIKNLYVYQLIFISSMYYTFIFLVNNYINLKTIDELVIVYFLVTLLSCSLTIIYHLKNIVLFKKLICFCNKIYFKK